MTTSSKELAAQLLAKRDTEQMWVWLRPGQAVSRKNANKFLLACILDYQMKAEAAWNNARRLAEEILGDPADLWGTIAQYTLMGWNRKRSTFALHRFPKGHERVYTIGVRIAHEYYGDARKIWEDKSLHGTLWRLNDLGVGPQLSNMVVGALVDCGHLTGKADVKADAHVCRVLGRLHRGRPYGPDETAQVIALARLMHPESPWSLDRPLYQLGKSVCRATAPKCGECFMEPACQYGSKRG